MILKIPCTYYQNETGVKSASINLRMDSDFVSRWAESSGRLYTWSGIQAESLRKLINEYLGYNLITSEVTFYIGRTSGDVVNPAMESILDLMRVSYDYVPGLTREGQSGQFPNITFKTLNDCVASGRMGHMNWGDGVLPILMYGYGPSINDSFMIDARYQQFHLNLYVYADDLFDEHGVVNGQANAVHFFISGHASSDCSYIKDCYIDVTYFYGYSNEIKNAFNPTLNLNGAQASDHDDNNPYSPGDDGDPGGDGDEVDPTKVDPTPIPDLPSIGASDFITIYGPSSANLKALSSFLWSADNIFDVNNFKKIYEDPAQTLIGLSILPCHPSASGQRNIQFGNIDTGVNSTYYTSQWCKVDCGSAKIETTARSFMDYSPYVKCQIFLPYCGFQSLNPDDIMGKTIHVVYHVDVVSGDLVCFIEVGDRGVIYSYTGNCLSTVPVCSSSFAGFLNRYYSTLAGAIPAMGNGAIAGGAAGAAGAGLNTLFNAANTCMFDAKPQYGRSGSMSGAASIMGVQRPFVIIERPNVSVPEYVENYAGLSANKTMSLGSCRGFTQVDFVHLDGIDATAGEIAEIESLLHKGVIL